MKLFNYVAFFEDRVYSRVLENSQPSLDENGSSVLDEAFYSSDGWAHIKMIAAIKLFDPAHFARASSGVVGKAIENEEAGLNGTFVSKSGEPILWNYLKLGSLIMAYTSVPENEVPDALKRGCVFAAGDSAGAPATPLRRMADSFLSVSEAPVTTQFHPASTICLSQATVLAFK